MYDRLQTELLAVKLEQALDFHFYERIIVQIVR